MCSTANGTGNAVRAFMGAIRGTFSRASKRCLGIFLGSASPAVRIIKLCKVFDEKTDRGQQLLQKVKAVAESPNGKQLNAFSTTQDGKSQAM